MRVNLVRVIARAPRVVSITRVPEAGVSIVEHVARARRVARRSIDSDDDVRLFDLDARAQLGEYAPFANSVVTSAVDPLPGTSRSAKWQGDAWTPTATSSGQARSISPGRRHRA